MAHGLLPTGRHHSPQAGAGQGGRGCLVGAGAGRLPPAGESRGGPYLSHLSFSALLVRFTLAEPRCSHRTRGLPDVIGTGLPPGAHPELWVKWMWEGMNGPPKRCNSVAVPWEVTLKEKVALNVAGLTGKGPCLGAVGFLLVSAFDANTQPCFTLTCCISR